MRRYIAHALFGIGVTIVAFVVMGFVQPYLNEETVITPTKIKVVRENGFMSNVTYQRDLVTGQEKVKILGSFPWRSERVVYNDICKCITEASRNAGDAQYSLSVHTDDAEVFFIHQNVRSESHGTIWLGWTMSLDKVQPEIAVAEETLNAARERFAEFIPKKQGG